MERKKNLPTASHASTQVEMKEGRGTAESVAKTYISEEEMVQKSEGSGGLCETLVIGLAWFIVTLIPVFWLFMFRTVTDYERALIFRLGKVQGGIRGPGFFVINPLLDFIKIVDHRIETINLPPQDMMTKDSVTIRVDGIVFAKVVNPVKAILEVDNVLHAIATFSATRLRSIVGMHRLPTLLTDRDRINSKLTKFIKSECKQWGVTVTAVEIKDVILPTMLQRSMAAEAETERERLAKKISSQGEAEAAENLARAATVIAEAPGALQLRYLHTLKNIAVEKNNTYIFPLPLELMEDYLETVEVKEDM